MHLRLCFASVAVWIGVCAQTPPPASSSPAQPPPIRVQVNEVIVPVTVTDEKGRFVSDLDKADFRIYDEGKEQTIRFFTRERSQPVVVGFLMDMSNASRLQWSHYQDAAIELALNLLPGDKKYSGYLISYSNDAEPIEPRRILVIIGDGHDNASKHTLNEVLEVAQRTLVTIYGVSTVAFGFNSPEEK